MTQDQIQEFVKKYSSSDFDKIKFDWNGKHGNDLEDKNIHFRMQICEYLKDDFSDSSDELILNLYLELSKSAKETWGVYNSFHLFANELLERGGAKYLDIYIEGATKSMDTGLMSGRLNLSKERLNEIICHIKSKMNNYENESEITGYDHMLKRFEWLFEKENKEKVSNDSDSLWQKIKSKFNF